MHILYLSRIAPHHVTLHNTALCKHTRDQFHIHRNYPPSRSTFRSFPGWFWVIVRFWWSWDPDKAKQPTGVADISNFLLASLVAHLNILNMLLICFYRFFLYIETIQNECEWIMLCNIRCLVRIILRITLASYWARWRLKSPALRLFTQPFIQGVDQRKHQTSASLAFVMGIHRWPFPAQRASKAENVSIWWRHDGKRQE